MQPIELPESMMEHIQKGTLVAINVGSPPAVTARVLLSADPDVSVGPVPELKNAAIIAVALSADLTFVDLVWIAKDELKQGKVKE